MKKNLTSEFSTRQYMNSKDFEIFYYNDKNLSKVKNHTHNYYEFYFFISGDVSMSVENTKYPLHPGDMILIPPNVPHHADILPSENAYQRFVFWISEKYCNELLSQSPNYAYLMQHAKISHQYVYHYDVLAFNEIQYKLFQLTEELHFERFGKKEKMELCVKDLIFHLNRSIYEKEHPSSPKEKQTLCQNLLTYIEEHLEEELSLETLAQSFYVSKYHVSHIFKENLGLSVHQYILKKRLTMSRDAILGNIEINEAFLLCGFKDYSSFFRAFKKEFGYSPREYKELNIQSSLTLSKE